MWIKTLFKNWFKDGISISYSDGPAFNPVNQERTDPLEDIAKNKEKKDGKHKVAEDL